MPKTPLALVPGIAAGAASPVPVPRAVPHGCSCKAAAFLHGGRPWERGVCPSVAHCCLQWFAEQAMLSALEGNPKPQRRANTWNMTFYPKSACF